ncbi:MAG: hypothetical protein R3266_03600 [Gemmatimonadota bacterium]|nr:hypothetical protein [Gemmatimonadota bacterium]
MARGMAITSDGSFEIEGHAYLIPREFSAREVYSYRRLMEPIPDIPGGTSLDSEQRAQQRAYFLRRAAACIIPGLQVKSLEGLPLGQLQHMHEWIVAHRPDLSEAVHPPG